MDTGPELEGGTGDVGTGDGPITDGPTGDGPTAPDCSGKNDGDPCGDPGADTICVSGQCVTSSCGDGYVNAAAGEECEDGNTVSGDGCTNCKYDCKADTDCDDGNVCTGNETCDTATHTCSGGALAPDGTACTQSAGGAGVCNGGVCVKAGCGNATKEGNEECDDGNSVAGDGCENDCTFTCKADADCDDQNKCTGTEICDKTNPQKPVCKAGTPVKCTAGGAGCTGKCEPATGQCVYPDADGDGVACDTDCKDTDPDIYPGASECADGKDNDCDPKTKDGADGDCKCYTDKDGDNFPPANAKSITAVTCPKGYTRKKLAATDCWDYNASAHPGQTGWFTKQYCAGFIVIGQPCKSLSWDYNCSKKIEKQYNALHTSCLLFNFKTGKVCAGSGWSGTTAAACGAKAKYTYCKLNKTKTSCLKSEQEVVQGCH